MAPRLAVVYSPNHEMSISSQQNKVSLLFISEHSHQNSGFHLRYSPETLEDQWKKNNIIYPKFHQHIIHNCGLELNTSTSAIFWRVSNELNVLCIWRITNNRGGRVLLKINELRINSDTGFARILDGSDCGAEVIHVFQLDTPIIPQEIQGKSNAMVIVFSITGGPESTINVTFVLQSPCFSSRPSASNGSIKLQNYSPKMFCSATLSAPYPHGIRMKLVDVSLEYDGLHLLDYLVIFDGPDCMAPRLTVAYGPNHQLPLSSRNNKVSLLFISDYSTQNAGFHLKYRPETRIDNWKKNAILDPNYQHILHNCGTELNTSTSNAMFLRILNETNTLCIWRITNDRGGTIVLHIEEVQINSSSGFVRILDGRDCNAEVIYVYERHTRSFDRKIHGTSNTMIVVLSAPSEYGATFKATVSYNIQSHCLLPQPSESEGSIELRHYPPKMFCTTTLSATNASGIRFEFVDMELEHSSRYLFDYLVIFDGPDCMAPRLTVVSGPNQPLSISSKRNKVSLLFISDYGNTWAGFHLRYSPETIKSQWKKNALRELIKAMFTMKPLLFE
ncbi:unnamed protein product [Dicrocoelium dendriticum]|nr:unnamed protein product [Dicrocoelium dendriticum]